MSKLDFAFTLWYGLFDDIDRHYLPVSIDTEVNILKYLGFFDY
jgi:hypothetical protein